MGVGTLVAWKIQFMVQCFSIIDLYNLCIKDKVNDFGQFNEIYIVVKLYTTSKGIRGCLLMLIL